MFLLDILRHKTSLVGKQDALPGRDKPISVPGAHFVNGNPLDGEIPGGFEVAIVAMGCFWGAERLFWKCDGVWSTAVGYAGGITPNPTYNETCTGMTAHAESVRIVFDPAIVSYADILKIFWEGHNPTQGMRQGNDSGTHYRSGIFTLSDSQADIAARSLVEYQRELSRAGIGKITTEVKPAGPFYYAEEYHQQYLAKNPGGYCGLGGTGVACPAGLTTPA